MAEVILNCPQCRRSLRVTDDLLGKPVKCPACGRTFTVASGQRVSQEPPLAEAADSPGGQAVHPAPMGGQLIPDPEAAKAYVVPASVCLLLAALLAFAFNVGQVILMTVISEDFWHKLPPWMADVPFDEGRIQGAVIGGLGALLALITVISSIQMARLRMYPLAIAGSVLAMVNCVNGCCVLGLPLGLWSLIILLRTDVRAAFQ